MKKGTIVVCGGALFGLLAAAACATSDSDEHTVAEPTAPPDAVDATAAPDTYVASICDDLKTLCGTQCFDLQNDPAHCGQCATTCAAEQVCNKGKCAASCPKGLVGCDGTCIDPKTNNLHCGATDGCNGPAAGQQCPFGTMCVNGTCRGQDAGASDAKAADGSSDGGDSCASRVLVDPNNCGQCGNVCPPSTPTCAAGTCVAGHKTVFVSSAQFDGNLGGLAGADQKCQALAQNASLSGTYRAWLSDKTGSPSTRFTQSTVPYTLVNGYTVAVSYAALVAGQILSPINMTEIGGTAPMGPAGQGCFPFIPVAWTNTQPNGTPPTWQDTSCNDWTTNVGSGTTPDGGGGAGALWGAPSMTDGRWTSHCTGGTCAWTAPLYCFEQ